MSNNKYSEVGAGEDLLRSIVQMACAEIHAQGLYYKHTSELDNGIVDVTDNDAVQRHIEKIEMFREDIEDYANLRRRMMNVLFGMFDNDKKDKNMWCQIKHLGASAYTAFETYQASDQDAELLMIAYDCNKAFVKAVTRFLGVEITECSSCFSDALKGVDMKGKDSDVEEENEL